MKRLTLPSFATALLFGCSSGPGNGLMTASGSGAHGGATSVAGGAAGSSALTAGTGGVNGTAGAPDSSGSGGASGAPGAGGTAVGGTGAAATGGSGGSSVATPGPDWGTPVAGGPAGAGTPVTVKVNLNTTLGNIGPEFAGFSYEKNHITNGSLTSSNTNLVALYKLIGSPLMRLGADEVDHCNWVGTGAAPSAPSGQPFGKNINSGMVDQLCGFLAATGSRVIYGVNFKAHDVMASAAEAAYVMGKCGSSTYGFEIGNEINRYGTWSALRADWEAMATAIVATPEALLVGPAGGGGDALSLSTPFASDESAKFGNKLVLLTQHYYAGTAGTATATVARLQTPDPDSPTSQDGLIGTESTMNKAATAKKIRDAYRCGECNTFSAHGQMGVSDTLIAALWGMDLMFVTAEQGGSGVNLHGGEQGMDGSRPFYYEPIMETGGIVVQVQPIYYSMLMLRMVGTGPVISTSLNTSNADFTAYAVKAGGYISVVLDNKSATTGVSATVDLGTAVKSASAMYLQGTPAGSLTAEATAVTFGGASVTNSGVWDHKPPYTQATSGNTVSVYVPSASAALVRVLQ